MWITTISYKILVLLLFQPLTFVCVCVCLGSLFEVLEEPGGPKANVAERLGKKRLHSGKVELPFRHGDDTSSNFLHGCLCF